MREALRPLPELLQCVNRPRGRMVAVAGAHPLDMSVGDPCEALLEIVGILPEVVPQPRTSGEPGRVDAREAFGKFGNGFQWSFSSAPSQERSWSGLEVRRP